MAEMPPSTLRQIKEAECGVPAESAGAWQTYSPPERALRPR